MSRLAHFASPHMSKSIITLLVTHAWATHRIAALRDHNNRYQKSFMNVVIYFVRKGCSVIMRVL
jgi:hypothetical protein